VQNICLTRQKQHQHQHQQLSPPPLLLLLLLLMLMLVRVRVRVRVQVYLDWIEPHEIVLPYFVKYYFQVVGAFPGFGGDGEQYT
jgi:hypothetical protein